MPTPGPDWAIMVASVAFPATRPRRRPKVANEMMLKPNQMRRLETGLRNLGFTLHQARALLLLRLARNPEPIPVRISPPIPHPRH